MSSRNSDAGSTLVINTSSRAGAGDIEQVTLGVVDLLQVSIVAHGFNALLERNVLVVAGHHDHRAELQSLARCMLLMETWPVSSR
jgi:hypothetical protein